MRCFWAPSAVQRRPWPGWASGRLGRADQSAVVGGDDQLGAVAGGAALFLTPALIGVFWGAPLVTRELEAGTLRLAWNQSVTRTRWMAAKPGPIDQVGGFPVTMGQLSRFSPLVFDARGFAPVGYAAFAFTLGVTVGVLTRRTLPAMAIVLACVAIVQLGWPTAVRPHLIPPAISTGTVSIDVSTAKVGHEGELAVPVTGMPGA